MKELDELFAFPIVLVDGDKEEAKSARGLGLPGEEEMDIVIAEAECPYYDFIGITDRWIPNDESFKKALEGKFEGCFVMFANMGGFIVPWTKSKFKKELRKFVAEVEKQDVTPKVHKVNLNPDQAKEILKIIKGEDHADETGK